jgi:CheY-like chemotaxis protein
MLSLYRLAVRLARQLRLILSDGQSRGAGRTLTDFEPRTLNLNYVMLLQVNSVDQGFKILIADRNRHVRNLLQRELIEAGYQVFLAGEDRELLRLLHDDHAADLLILDPDLPSSLNISELITLLHGRKPTLPIVIYTFLNDGLNYRDLPGVAMCLEKGEDFNLLKEGVTKVINKYYSPGLP